MMNAFEEQNIPVLRFGPKQAPAQKETDWSVASTIGIFDYALVASLTKSACFEGALHFIDFAAWNLHCCLVD